MNNMDTFSLLLENVPSYTIPIYQEEFDAVHICNRDASCEAVYGYYDPNLSSYLYTTKLIDDPAIHYKYGFKTKSEYPRNL